MNNETPATEATSTGVVNTKEHDNVVVLDCSDILTIAYDEKYFNICPGQPYKYPPNITVKGANWNITLTAGRSNSSEVADNFNNWSSNGNLSNAGQNEMQVGGEFSTSTPGTLHFAFGISCLFMINGVACTVELFIGQGYTMGVNNWWLGSPNINNGDLSVKDSNGNVIRTYGITGSGTFYWNTFILSQNN